MIESKTINVLIRMDRELKVNENWCYKLKELSVGERGEIINKIINRYHSPEYITKHLDKNGNVKKPLYDVLFTYAQKFGERVSDNALTSNNEIAYIIDREFYISVSGVGINDYICFKLMGTYDYYMDNITEELIYKNKFQKKIIFGTEYYQIDLGDFIIEIVKMSNMYGRNWSIHIDNSYCDSIARVDIQTVQHFNDLMKLMNINFTFNRPFS